MTCVCDAASVSKISARVGIMTLLETSGKHKACPDGNHRRGSAHRAAPARKDSMRTPQKLLLSCSSFHTGLSQRSHQQAPRIGRLSKVQNTNDLKRHRGYVL